MSTSGAADLIVKTVPSIVRTLTELRQSAVAEPEEILQADAALMSLWLSPRAFEETPSQVGRRGDKQRDREAERQRGREAEGLAGRQAGRRAGRQAGRWLARWCIRSGRLRLRASGTMPRHGARVWGRGFGVLHGG